MILNRDQSRIEHDTTVVGDTAEVTPSNRKLREARRISAVLPALIILWAAIVLTGYMVAGAPVVAQGTIPAPRPPTNVPEQPPINVPEQPPTNVPEQPPTNVPEQPPTNIPEQPSTNVPQRHDDGKDEEAVSSSVRATHYYAPCKVALDGYEYDDTRQTANEITGPEDHTFSSNIGSGWDQDWSTFTARQEYIYQIRARSHQPHSITDPMLRLYDEDGNLLAENRMDIWGQGAEIWFWNDGPTQALYVQVLEEQDRYGCRHYRLEVNKWKAFDFQYRFSTP